LISKQQTEVILTNTKVNFNKTPVRPIEKHYDPYTE